MLRERGEPQSEMIRAIASNASRAHLPPQPFPIAARSASRIGFSSWESQSEEMKRLVVEEHVKTLRSARRDGEVGAGAGVRHRLCLVCFHCLRSKDTAFALSSHCLRG